MGITFTPLDIQNAHFLRSYRAVMSDKDDADWALSVPNGVKTDAISFAKGVPFEIFIGLEQSNFYLLVI